MSQFGCEQGECSLVYNNTLGKGIEVYSWFITLFGHYHLSPHWPADSGLLQNGHNVSAWGIPLLVLEHGRGKRWARQYSCWCFGRNCPLLEWLRDVISENICTESICVTYTTTSCNHLKMGSRTRTLSTSEHIVTSWTKTIAWAPFPYIASSLRLATERVHPLTSCNVLYVPVVYSPCALWVLWKGVSRLLTGLTSATVDRIYFLLLHCSADFVPIDFLK